MAISVDKTVVYILLLLHITVVSIQAQEDTSLMTTSAIDWQKGKLDMTIEVDLEKRGAFIPTARYTTEIEIDTRLPLLFQEDLQFAFVDSYHTVGDVMMTDPLLSQELYKVAKKGRKVSSHLSKQMDRFIVRYEFDLYPDIITPFIGHSQPYPVPRIIDYVPTTAFSGIVIYMQGVFPVHGEEKNEELNPCLFPKIFDRNMMLILEAGMIPPETLKTRGIAAYTDTVDETPFVERIGYAPLRIMGTGIFGKQYTDIIIPVEDAHRILYSQENRSLLTEGKILIICNRAETELVP